MALDKLNIEEKIDNETKRKLLDSGLVAEDETLSANEVNKIVDKVNELVDGYNFGTPITGFNFKENVATYADLLAIEPETLEVNDGFGVLADGLVYVWNGSAFADEGNGIDLGLKAKGEINEEDLRAVSGAKVFKSKEDLLLNFIGAKERNMGVYPYTTVGLSQQPEGYYFFHYDNQDKASNTFVSEVLVNIEVAGTFTVFIVKDYKLSSQEILKTTVHDVTVGENYLSVNYFLNNNENLVFVDINDTAVFNRLQNNTPPYRFEALTKSGNHTQRSYSYLNIQVFSDSGGKEFHLPYVISEKVQDFEKVNSEFVNNITEFVSTNNQSNLLIGHYYYNIQDKLQGNTIKN